MLPEPFVERLGQPRRLGEQCPLSVLLRLQEDVAVHDVLVCQPNPVALADLEREATAADALGLFPDDPEVLAADRNPHPAHPVPQALPEHYFAAARPQGLRLQVDEDQPGPTAKGHTDVDRLAARTA